MGELIHDCHSLGVGWRSQIEDFGKGICSPFRTLCGTRTNLEGEWPSFQAAAKESDTVFAKHFVEWIARSVFVRMLRIVEKRRRLLKYSAVFVLAVSVSLPLQTILSLVLSSEKEECKNGSM